MARYTQDSKEKVRDAVDMFELVASRTEIKRSGPGAAMARCPFHDERTASFSVDLNRKLYNCFGCGVSGDCFTFVRETEGLDFVGAMEQLAQRFNVPLEVEEEDPAAAQRRAQRERLLELLDRTAAFYERFLWESREATRAREYLASRGLGEQVLRTFRVGYSPKAWDTVLLASRRAGYSNRELFDAGLARKAQGGEGRLYDWFRGRIMFPLADRRGRVMGFGARTLSTQDGPKYLNSGDSPVFHKKMHVYGADIARPSAAKSGEVIVCEGYTDVIALHQAGMPNVVGQMGTSLTTEQVAELARLAPVVHLALDADEAGQNAMVKAASVARGNHVSLRVVELPEGRDPADVVSEEGPDAMRALVAASVPFVRFRVRRELERGDRETAEGKDAIIGALRPVFADVPVGAVRDELVKLVADRLDLKPLEASGWLSGGAGARGSGQATPGPAGRGGSPRQGTGGGTGRPQGNGPAPSRRALGAAEEAERELLAAVIAFPQAGAAELERLEADAVLTLPVHRLFARRLLAGEEAPEVTEDPAQAEALASLDVELRAKAAFLAAQPDTLRSAVLAVEVAAVERAIEHRTHDGSGGVADLKRRLSELQKLRHVEIERRMARAEED
jgi:DNA primase